MSRRDPFQTTETEAYLDGRPEERADPYAGETPPCLVCGEPGCEGRCLDLDPLADDWHARRGYRRPAGSPFELTPHLHEIRRVVRALNNRWAVPGRRYYAGQRYPNGQRGDDRTAWWWGVVERWQYPDRPDLGWFGGAFSTRAAVEGLLRYLGRPIAQILTEPDDVDRHRAAGGSTANSRDGIDLFVGPVDAGYYRDDDEGGGQ